MKTSKKKFKICLALEVSTFRSLPILKRATCFSSKFCSPLPCLFPKKLHPILKMDHFCCGFGCVFLCGMPPHQPPYGSASSYVLVVCWCVLVVFRFVSNVCLVASSRCFPDAATGRNLATNVFYRLIGDVDPDNPEHPDDPARPRAAAREGPVQYRGQG